MINRAILERSIKLAPGSTVPVTVRALIEIGAQALVNNDALVENIRKNGGSQVAHVDKEKLKLAVEAHFNPVSLSSKPAAKPVEPKKREAPKRKQKELTDEPAK